MFIENKTETNCLACENLIDQLEIGRGYSLDLSLTQSELNNIRSLLNLHWLKNIKKYSPENLERFSENGIERYHELSHLIDHHEAWPKSNRIFPQSSVDYIRSTSLIKDLEKIYGDFSISDEENIGREEMYWRLVRPAQSSDMGALHADAWFWELGHGITPPNTKRVKVWIALFCEPGLSGLRVVPESHKKMWPYHGEYRDGFMKPQIDIKEEDVSAQTVYTKPGDAIVFHDRLLHGGAPNTSKKTRVSMEFTMLIRQ
ncbi:MAG: phytanoyl-CoA dioxygenase family protein [Coxiellaceae bacterium]|nr:phytanoyl-CoA dioxygenase family protein [Coxiellaceae bacterium]